MRKILISAVAAGAIFSQVSAVDVYKDGDNSVSVFGTVRAVGGYGYAFGSTAAQGSYNRSQKNDIIFGAQGNSRIGVGFKYDGFFGEAIVGVNERTLLSSQQNTPGFRQIYAGYNFGAAGKLIVGKLDTLTSMAGFSSDIFDGDSGLNGFGGHATSVRRIQVQYTLPFGLGVSISENDALGSHKTNWQKSIPRLTVGYEYKGDGLRAKVGASYAYKPSKTSGTTADTYNDMRKHIFLLNAGVKPTFGDQYVSALFTYGLNSQLIGENRIAGATLSSGINNLSLATTGNSLNGVTMLSKNSDVNIVAFMVEYGIKLTPDLKAIAGVGYQHSSSHNGNGGYNRLNAYSVFVQMPYSFNKYFSIIPQVGYLGTTTNKQSKTTHNTGGIFALAQLRFNF